MYFSSTDIASFRTARETVLVGPPSAFGTHTRSLLVRERSELRRVFDRLIITQGCGPALRRSIGRWGLDVSVTTRRESSHLPAWLTAQAVRGSIAMIVVPDPTVAYSGIVDLEDDTMTAVQKAVAPKQMTTSKTGLGALAAHEGAVLTRYRDSVGVWTIGIGHTAAAGRPDPALFENAMSLSQAFALFRRDLAKYEREVNAALSISVEQHEFDALVSFHYNTGAIARAELVKRLNNGDRKGAADGFLNWMRPPEIRGRRREEMLLFRDGTYPKRMMRVYTADTDGVVDRKSGRVIDPSSYLGPDANPGLQLGLPDLIEERLVMVLIRVPGFLTGEVREKYLELIRTMGLTKLTSSMLVWNAQNIAPALCMDLGVLAYDQASLSGQVMRAARELSLGLVELGEIQARSQLPPLIKRFAHAIAVLIVNRLFDRLLQATKLTKGQSTTSDKATSKPGR